MNFSSVASKPSEKSPDFDPQTAYADALSKARQAAQAVKQKKELDIAIKRPHEDSDKQEPATKKVASESGMDAVNTNPALQAAAAAAAQINQKLGNPSGNAMMGVTQVQSQMQVTENYSVPDRLVGLIIGKGGEHIMQIQAETGCKVQFSPDAAGKPDRPCIITGPKSSIDQAKAMIQSYIEKGSGLPEPLETGQAMQELMIPGHKVGLVIGKGGETIKNLQEYHKVKMVMIQESNVPTADDKPLRITGDPQRCAQAMDAVKKLMADKDAYAPNAYGGGMTRPLEVSVPRPMVGIVIGKSGEMIRKIQVETGAKVQFVPDDNSSPDRVCTISGPPEKAQQAAQMISELITSAGGQMPNFNGGSAPVSGAYGTPPQSQVEHTFSVPREKCGLVIGKGGQTVQDLCRISNAHIELKRNQPQNADQREFTIKGTPDQCYHAVQLISEKAGIQAPPREQFSNSFGGNSGYQQQPTYQNAGYGQAYGQQQANWNSAYGSAGNWQQGGADPNKQDPNQQAAWAAYYNQYYQGQQQQQPQQGQQPAPQTTQSSNLAPQMNPQTGQPDYSAAWADYYRQQGMHYHADMILAQARGSQQGGATAPQPHPST